MKKAAEKTLSSEDRILWMRVASTTTPLKGRSSVSFDEPSGQERDERESVGNRLDKPVPSNEPARPLARIAQDRPPPQKLDLTTRKKLAKGRLPLEGTVDLHGLNQHQAHALLLSFLHRAHADGRRHVLIITGKGDSFRSDGILRRAVPEWLSTSPFRALVGGQEGAARNHGGAGAIYVRLRRRGGGGRE